MLIEKLSDESLSVEQMMKIIKEAIVSKVANEDSRENIDINELKSLSEQNTMLCKINYWQPLKSNIRFVGFVVTFIKKVIRRLLRWFILPLIQEQNNANESFAKSISKCVNFINSMNEEHKETIEKVYKLQNEIEDLKNQIQKLQNR